MSRTSRLRHLLAPAALAALLVLTGCSGDASDDPGAASSSDGGDGGDSSSSQNQFSAGGVSFEAPKGWESLDNPDISDSQTADLAKGLGLTAEQLAQTLQNVDLFLVDGDGPQDGFLSNINVLGQTGALPANADLESQFTAIGAKVLEVTNVDTGAGKAAVVAYTLTVGERTIEGVSYLVSRDGEVVTVTVSTPDRAETDAIGGAIGESLDAAS